MVHWAKTGVVSLLSACLWCAAPTGAWAGKPDWVEQGGGNGKGAGKDHDRGNAKHKDKSSPGQPDVSRDRERVSSPIQGAVQIGGSSGGISIVFGDSQRRIVHDYFAPQIAAGKCPPGLAKKNNGCLPPGQAKQWARGRPLPAGVVTYPLPRDLEIRLGVPPAGHKYVRVAADILLIAVGTSLVVDAIEDLAGL